MNGNAQAEKRVISNWATQICRDGNLFSVDEHGSSIQKHQV
jgi:hypothetical protein